MFRTTRLVGTATRRMPVFQRRLQSTQQPPEPPKSEEPKSNPHRDFYKYRSRPVFKSVLVAIFTYQVLYWGWLKLESMETKHNKEGELRSIESEIRRHAQGRKSGST
ncbi:hypothetical protein WHR41_02892 [Cladosporium halotolerans]|uniref:Uncharacterized protein n=1 Tax=Cladosporium halotolerans TaxID=1052096 RepID=A0AB34KUS5_9PEZI